ncbi:MAG: hypothetical protein E5V86_11460 [Mesorhizobium sp.]|nr:MAG: hypothetical protein E5W02_01895 [Mesorhizobium sp.]TIV65602.1 MAG: hypothetical protein E5V86_11460 [Mesorhizobium sp.]
MWRRRPTTNAGAAPHPPLGTFSPYRDGEKEEAATPWPGRWAHLEHGSGPTRTCMNGMAIITRGFITVADKAITKGRRCVTYVRFQ